MGPKKRQAQARPVKTSSTAFSWQWPGTAAAVLAVIAALTLAALSSKVDNNGGWLLDPDPLDIDSDICTIERVHVRNLSQANFDRVYSGSQPVLIDGMIDSWPAR